MPSFGEYASGVSLLDGAAPAGIVRVFCDDVAAGGIREFDEPIPSVVGSIIGYCRIRRLRDCRHVAGGIILWLNPARADCIRDRGYFVDCVCRPVLHKVPESATGAILAERGPVAGCVQRP